MSKRASCGYKYHQGVRRSRGSQGISDRIPSGEEVFFGGLESDIVIYREVQPGGGMM